MNLFLKQSAYKKTGLAILLIAIIAGSSYLTYDKFFAKKMVVASINPYNFTDFDVADLYVNGGWGGSSNRHSGGGSSVCCALIPEKWRPGLVVNVKWLSVVGENEQWHTAQAEIPEYAEPAGLQVIFLKDNKIKVYVMDYWPCSAKHPMPKDKELCGEPQKPWWEDRKS